MVALITSKNISQLSISETVIGGTVCGKTARTDLWGCGEVTNRPTRTLDFLLQGRIAANTGTSSIFDARHDGDHVCALKNRWSTRLYCTSAFHDETLMNNPGLRERACLKNVQNNTLSNSMFFRVEES
jgi:hypothetical protein